MRALTLAIVCLPALAGAVEGESTLAFTPRFSSLTVAQERGGDRAGLGAGLAIDYQKALSDTLWFRVAGGGAWHEGPLWSGTATAGITYSVDVIRYVPYVSAGLGGAVVGGDVDTEVHPYLELGVGVDVLESRRWSWGVDARVSSFFSGVTIFEIGPRLTLRWGYF